MIIPEPFNDEYHALVNDVYELGQNVASYKRLYEREASLATDERLTIGERIARHEELIKLLGEVKYLLEEGKRLLDRVRAMTETTLDELDDDDATELATRLRYMTKYLTIMANEIGKNFSAPDDTFPF